MNKDIYRDKIKKEYLQNFNREITEKEANFIMDKSLNRVEKELKQLPDFTESQLELYLNDSSMETSYSPAVIYSEINLSIKENGEDYFSKSREYKKAREMEIAARLCLSIKKNTGQEWMIKIQDSPDIVLFKISKRSIKTSFLDAIQVEIMKVPEQEIKKWEGNFIYSLLRFIREKKFKKRYGECILIINLDFEYKNLNLISVNKSLASIKPNPFSRILITAIITPDYKNLTVTEIYPNYFMTNFNIDEKDLLY